VDELRQPGDLVVMAPSWAEPMARRALGDERMPVADLARPDESGYRHAIEIGALAQRAASLDGWREVARLDRGDFVLRRLENPTPAPSKLDFVSALGPDGTEVRFREAPCTWRHDAPVSAGGLGGHPTFPAQRFICSSNPFFNVGVTVIADEQFRARRCIWAHPPAAGELVLRYPGVQLGERIVGHGGMYWMVEREGRGAPIELEVRIGGAPLGVVTHRDGDGWAAFDLELGANAGRRADVEFAVRTSDNRHRHFCFEARTR
jgi:hypothetical protein